MPDARILMLTALSLIWLCSSANATMWRDFSGYIWKPVSAAPGEDLWQSCRRNFGYDAIRARRGAQWTVYCFVPSSYLYDPGQ